MNKAQKVLRSLKETGEMSASELEPEGEWYEFRLELENLCKEAGLKCQVKPFDQYQGPYGYIDGIGNLWGIQKEESPEMLFYLDTGGAPGEGYEGDREDMVDHLKSLKGKGRKK